MTQRLSILSIVVLAVFFVASNSFAQQGFPFLGQITEDGVNVRAGQNKNFESLCKLNKGDEVVVLAQSYSWYKIQLPAQAPVYISDKYVTRLKSKQGKVTADKVNVRAGPDIYFSVIGQVSKDEIVAILGEKPGWFRIAPVAQSYGWVKKELVSFKSGVVPSLSAPVAVPEPEEERAVFEVKKIEQPLPQARSNIVIEGKLSALKQAGASGIHYQLTGKDKRVYLVKGLSFALDNFVGFNVRVEGSLEQENHAQTPSLVVNVSKIQLIL